jgi:GT2 family glycosyltransferase
MKNHAELSIIIVNYNVRQLLLDCIQTVINTANGIEYEIIVVDNVSSDGSVEAVRKSFPSVQVIANKKNVGFAQANNQGYKISEGDFILLLNPDTIVKPDAIKNTLEFMKKTPGAGIAACRLLNPDGSLQKSIRSFPSISRNVARVLFIDRILLSENRRATYYRMEPLVIDYCAAAYMMVRGVAIGEMALLNPDFFMYSEEKDLALRIKEKGWKTYFVPFGEIIHYGEQSTRQMPEEMFLELQRSQIKFFKKNYPFFYAWALALTWGLVLFSNLLVSILLVLSPDRRGRLRLFFQAVIYYPFMFKDLFKVTL